MCLPSTPEPPKPPPKPQPLVSPDYASGDGTPQTGAKKTGVAALSIPSDNASTSGLNIPK